MSEIVLDKRPPNPKRVPRVRDPRAEGRVFCNSPACPLCLPDARLTRFIRIARLPDRVFRLVQKDPASASACIRRLLLGELHRPGAALKREERPYEAPGPAGMPGKYVRVTEAMHQELKRRGLKVASFVSSLIVREFGAAGSPAVISAACGKP